MSMIVCGVCDQDWHTKGYGWVWIEGFGLHQWQEPNKEQIKQRLRKRYGLV